MIAWIQENTIQSTDRLTDGRGVDWQLESAWPAPAWWFIALIIVACLAVAGLHFWRTDGLRWTRQQVALVALRCGALAVVLCMIGGWQIARYEVDLPDLILLVDSSKSMSLPAAETDSTTAGGQSRWEAVADLLGRDQGRWLAELQRQYRLRLLSIGKDLSTVVIEDSGQSPLIDLQPRDEQSRLGDLVSRVLAGQRGRSTAAIVMLSDGVVTDGIGLEQVGQEAASARLPLFAVRTGSIQPPPQIELAELVAESTAMVGDSVRIMARVRWQGIVGGRLTIRLVDQDGNRELAKQPVVSSPLENGSAMVALNFTATEPGLRRLRVEVEPVAGEIAKDDNYGEVSVEIRDESFRVLLVQGQPTYEFRFLKHLLERATSRDGSIPLVELTSVLQSGDPRYADQDKAARRLPPVDDASLEKLDLIILSDCDPAGLGRVLQNRIVDLVTQAGTSLFVIAGPENLPQKLAGTSLERLLPVDPRSVSQPPATQQPLRWQLSTLGRSIPSLQISTAEDGGWSRAPAVYWLAETNDIRPGARVLLETIDRQSNGRGAPVVINQLAGNGQVWLQLTDESFRLRAADADSELYESYWLQLVRALAKRRPAASGDEARLAILGERFSTGVAIPFEVELGSQLASSAGGEVEIAVVGPSGVSTTFKAAIDAGGRSYRGLIEDLDAGSYRALLTQPIGRQAPASDTFVVERRGGELQETTVDLQSLTAMTDLSGGKVIDITAAATELPKVLPEGRKSRIRALEPRVIWNHWSVALLLFGLLSTEWILRRKFGSL